MVRGNDIFHILETLADCRMCRALELRLRLVDADFSCAQLRQEQ